MKERYEQLDALRGMAAFSVMMMHLFPPGIGFVFDLLQKAYSPLSFIFKGREAVDFFFILSGFVLSLPLLDGGKQRYSQYLIKRFFRIYVPYIASVFVMLYFRSPQLGETFLGDHLVALGNFDTRPINGVYWTLVHEMRISLIFPLIVIVFRNLKFYYTLAAGFLLYLLGQSNLVYGWEHSASVDVDTSYIASAYYVSLFLYGMLIAKHRHQLIGWYRKQGRAAKYLLLAFSFVCYNYSINFIEVLLRIGTLRSFDLLTRDLLVSAGVCGLMVIALASDKMGNALRTRIPAFIGRISFSLYLYHGVARVALDRYFSDAVPAPLLRLVAVIVSIAAAYAGWRLIEKPAMGIGKGLAQRLISLRKSMLLKEERKNESITTG